MAFGLDLGNLLVHLRADDKQYNSVMRNAEKRMKALSDKLTRIGRTMTMRVTAPLVAIAGAATKSFASFDDAMTQSLAIMKDITPGLRAEMEKIATDISKRSITSATQLAKSYFYLASAGLSAKQSIAALAIVERFAVAGRFDMALATDLVTDAQSALGLTVKDVQKNMENMTRISDVLVGANTLANASVQQFSEALMRAGPAMKAYGIEVEEGTAVLAAYADQGKKGAEGGELFSRMLRLMIKGFIDNKAAWDKFSISIVDANDKMRPLADIVRDLTDLLSGMGVTQKGITLAMLGFQARSQQTIMPLLGMADAIEKYNELLLDMASITREVAEKQLKSFSSQMKIMWNNVTDVARDIGGMLAPRILELNEHITRATEWWGNLNKETKQSILLYAAVAAAIGPVLIATGLLIKTLVFIVATVRVLTSPFFLLIGIIYVFRAVWLQNIESIRTGIEWMATSFKTFLGWFVWAFTTSYNFILKKTNELVGGMAGTAAGAAAWLKTTVGGGLEAMLLPPREMAKALAKSRKEAAENFAKAFVEAEEVVSLGVGIPELSPFVLEKYKAVATMVKAFGIGVIESMAGTLEELMTTVKTQFGEDADAIIALIKSKIEALQGIPMSIHEELRQMLEKPETRLEIITQEIEAQKAVVRETARAAKQLSEAEETIVSMLAELDVEYEMLGKISEERERAVRLMKFEKLLNETYVDDLEKINELMTQYVEKLDKIATGRTGFGAFTKELKQWHNEATNIWQNLGDIAVNALDRTADALADMVLRGKADFKSLARSVIQDLTRMIIKAQMAQALGVLFPSLTAALFGAPAAAPGSPYTSPHGGAAAPTLQHGGAVAETGWAVVHKGETFSGVDEYKKSSEIHIYNEGTGNLEITKAEEYLVSDRRVVDIWIRESQTNVRLRRAVTQVR